MRTTMLVEVRFYAAPNGHNVAEAFHGQNIAAMLSFASFVRGTAGTWTLAHLDGNNAAGLHQAAALLEKVSGCPVVMAGYPAAK